LTAPPVVVIRSIFRGRVVYAVPGWLLDETDTHIVTATLPGAETLQLAGPRSENIDNVVAGREQTLRTPWERNRVVWMTPLHASHSIGHFWNDASGVFVGYYVNLQAPLRRSPFGFDSQDHLLDIVIEPDRQWRWKDEDELALAVQVGLLSAYEAVTVRAEGQRVLSCLDKLLPTGWENWQPDSSWPQLRLPPGIERC
jgi:hypothetical protein